jgi:DNA polymerase III delta prime subunit
MEKLNFEQLKKDTLVEVKNEYIARVSHGERINSPLMKILFDYFNVLNDKKKMQKEQGLYVNGFVNGSNAYCENLPERVSGGLNFKVNLGYKDEFTLLIVLSRYQIDKNWVSEVTFTSNKPSYVSSEFIYKKIIYSAIAHSNLKGSYFTMPPDALAWEKRTLERRDYGDIYLPKKTMEDLKLFTSLYEKKGEIMRYLFAGTPGTGKTESTLAISNILKNGGVTIIKTVVCDALKEKVELAELLAPSLIIFDDIDLSLGSRTKGGVSRSLGTFLDALDGTDKISAGVGIIATTNSIDLLDLAAQRPGRFDKIMSFETITQDNIRDIILKSLRSNFGFGKNHPATSKFTDKKVVDFFYDSKLTGSHVYIYTKQIMRKIETLDITKYDAKWILSELEDELTTVKTITNARYLQSGQLKGEDSSKRMGLVPNNYDESEDVDYENEVCEEAPMRTEEEFNEDVGMGEGDDMHEKGHDN